MKGPKIDTSAQERAAKAAAAAQQAANNLETNLRTDLTTENVTQVNAAGSAADIVTGTDSAVRKKRNPNGLSATLGIM